MKLHDNPHGIDSWQGIYADYPIPKQFAGLMMNSRGLPDKRQGRLKIEGSEREENGETAMMNILFALVLGLILGWFVCAFSKENFARVWDWIKSKFNRGAE